MAERISTGGGAAVDGDVTGGFVGRDRDEVHGGSVHIALNRIADVSEREADQIQRLAAQIETLADQVGELSVALAGSRYGQPGLVQRVDNMAAGDKRRERIQLINALVLAAIGVGQLVHTIAIWNLYRWMWWGT